MDKSSKLRNTVIETVTWNPPTIINVQTRITKKQRIDSNQAENNEKTTAGEKPDHIWYLFINSAF